VAEAANAIAYTKCLFISLLQSATDKSRICARRERGRVRSVAVPPRTAELVTLAAAGLFLAFVAACAAWAAGRRWNRNILSAAWPLATGGLAVLYANLAGGAPARRSAIAWMVGSWGARLGVHLVWSALSSAPADPSPRCETDAPPRVPLAIARVTWVAFFYSVPALIASVDVRSALTGLELAAAGVWVIGFAGEATADRQFGRWQRAGGGDRCTVGIWRYLPRAHDAFELLIWAAHAVFALQSPLGWVALACPAAAAYRIFTGGTGRAQL
jgi:steroid 5-alpha reductase family enzyme